MLGPALAVAVVALMEALSYTSLKVAVSPPILILPIVCASFVGGIVDGLIAAGVTVWYYAYELSSPALTFPYTHEALRRVLVFACSAPAVALMVGLLKQRAARATAEAARKERESADAVYTSLTWTREADRSGREAERRFRGFFDTSVVGVMHTLREGRVVECNQTLVDVLGCDSRDELMTMDADRLFEDPAEYNALLTEVGRGSARAERDVALWRRSGKPLWARVSVRPLNEVTRTVFEWSVVDIARQRSAESRAAALQADLDRHQGKQSALSQELEGCAYAVALDLRGPMRSLNEISQALLAGYGLKLDAAGRANLTRLAATGGAMERLVQSLLELARSSGSEMRRSAVDLSALAQLIVQALRAGEPERKVDVTIAQGLTAVGDPALLRQALTHLIGNAWAFTKGRPTACIEIGETKAEGCRAYMVRDDGGGLDRAYAGPLPGAIQRLRSADEWPGAGLALAMVQRIVQRHGGRMWSEGGLEGATFYFTLEEPPGPPAASA
ncbi:MAG TPA: ATP-binding protein [Methylomirabilota bacterium]